MFKVPRNGLLRYILHTCPNLWCNPCSKCHGMDCFGTYSTHVQTCDVTRVQSATEWTASVHTSHMSRPVIGYYRTERKNALGHKPRHRARQRLAALKKWNSGAPLRDDGPLFFLGLVVVLWRVSTNRFLTINCLGSQDNAKKEYGIACYLRECSWNLLDVTNQLKPNQTQIQTWNKMK